VKEVMLDDNKSDQALEAEDEYCEFYKDKMRAAIEKAKYCINPVCGDTPLPHVNQDNSKDEKKTFRLP